MATSTDYIFGIRAVIEAIRSDKTIDKLFIKKGLQGELSHELLELVTSVGINYVLVPEEKLNRITMKNHQGVVAFLSPVPFYDFEEVVLEMYESGEMPFILMLDEITDVRNFGAIVRTAECAGVNTIIIPTKGSAQIGADAVKTSAGALHYIKVCKVKSLNQAVRRLQESGVKVIAATEKASTNYTDSDMTGPVAIVMGSEDIGISNDLIRISDELVKIPIIGKIQSLNVSVAAGILLYEVIRQRK